MSAEPESGTESPTAPSTAEVVFYARPGCPFCTLLRSGLKKRGLDFREVDIWQDPEAAAAVRAAADGNETVPTVNVGSTWMVNPSADQVLAAVAAEAPDLLPAEGAARPGPLSRLFHRGD